MSGDAKTIRWPSPERSAVRPSAIAGVGLGLRWEFDEELVETLPPVDFLEIAPENYARRGGYHSDALAYLAAHYPIVTHGLAVSLGGLDPLDTSYLADVRDLIGDVKSPWHSDHLSFGTVDGRRLHDLLPVAFTNAGVRRFIDRARRVEDAVGVPFAVENISFYLPPEPDEMPEAEFIQQVCEGAGCGFLLDVNNLYVNATNQGFNAIAWLDAAPLGRVVQIHVAGHGWFDEGLRAQPAGSDSALIVDTHGAPVPDPVLALLREAIRRVGDVPVVLERDYAIPSLSALLAEIAIIKDVVASAGSAEQHPRLR